MKSSKNIISVRKEVLQIEGTDELKIAFLSDFHFTKRSVEFSNSIYNACLQLNPDLILLGGDYSDSKQGLIVFENLVQNLKTISPIVAIPGNHDLWARKTATEEVFKRLTIPYFNNQTYSLKIKDQHVNIDCGTPSNHKLSGTNILSCHNPKLFNKIKTPYRVAFAGHLHGSQVVLWENSKGMYPGRLLYKFNQKKIIIKNTTAFISLGLGDTIPIRYNCNKEIVCVELIPKKP